MLRVAAFTGGLSVPSARFRVRQYVPALSKEGVLVTEFPARFGRYPPRSRTLRPLWAVATLADRVPALVKAMGCDLTLLQREMLSTFFTLEGLTKAPRVLDVDDAIWLHRGGGFARRLAESCDLVVCGNEYLAETFGRWNRNVTIVPTGVDTTRFSPGPQVNKPVIGWSGTSGNLKYVYEIEAALEAVLRKVPEARLRIVCDAPPAFRRVPPSRVEYLRWSPQIEVAAIQGMAVGIMPLHDSSWTRGKCSFKMLTYMACGVPVVASPVGMNVDVLKRGPAGLPARTVDEWTGAVGDLCHDVAGRRAMGEVGRSVVAEHYSTDVVGPVLAQIFKRAACSVPTRDTARGGDVAD